MQANSRRARPRPKAWDLPTGPRPIQQPQRALTSPDSPEGPPDDPGAQYKVWAPRGCRPGLGTPHGRTTGLTQACRAPALCRGGGPPVSAPCAPDLPGHGLQAPRQTGAARRPGPPGSLLRHRVRQTSGALPPFLLAYLLACPRRRSPGPCSAGVPANVCAAVRPSWRPAPSAASCTAGAEEAPRSPRALALALTPALPSPGPTRLSPWEGQVTAGLLISG